MSAFQFDNCEVKPLVSPTVKGTSQMAEFGNARKFSFKRGSRPASKDLDAIESVGKS